ncbi:MAG TPA: TraR/DksA C4-type zinc finger protein [Gaiellaceae bacterium]|nr:TraR/DksA C4-type zinc finger protein [Gaiellaceae bacterium]
MSLDLERFRLTLERERARLLGALEAVNHDRSQVEEAGDLASGPGDHLADTATDTFIRELDVGLEENAEHLLEEVEAALRRIEEGSFGRCEACGRPIAPERLEAVPYARLCLEDKRAQEQG